LRRIKFLSFKNAPVPHRFPVLAGRTRQGIGIEEKHEGLAAVAVITNDLCAVGTALQRSGIEQLLIGGQNASLATRSRSVGSIRAMGVPRSVTTIPPKRTASRTRVPVFSCNWRSVTCFTCHSLTQCYRLVNPNLRIEQKSGRVARPSLQKIATDSVI